MVQSTTHRAFLQGTRRLFLLFALGASVLATVHVASRGGDPAAASEAGDADKNSDNQVDAKDLTILLKEWQDKNLSFDDIILLGVYWRKGIMERSDPRKISKDNPTATHTQTITLTETPTETPIIPTGWQGDPYGYIPPTFSGAINKNTLPGPPTGKDIDVAYIERRPRIDFDDAQPMPTVGSQVTFRAHINNRGSQEAGGVNFQWYINGTAAQGQGASGSFNLTGSGSYVMETHHTQDYTVTWVSTSFDVGIECWLQNGSDLYDENNSVTINSHSPGIGWWAHESFALYFLSYQRDLGIGSNSMEDYLQRMCTHWNYIMERSVYPSLPNGIPQRVHLDYVKVVSDPIFPTPTPAFGNFADVFSGQPRNKTVDFIWGGQFSDVYGGYGIHDSTSITNIFFYNNSTVHELLHAFLVDTYGFDCPMGGAQLVSAIGPTSSSLDLTGNPDYFGIQNSVGYLKSMIDNAYLLGSVVNGELISSPLREFSGGNTTFSSLTRGASGTSAQSHTQNSLFVRADCRIVDNSRLVAGSQDLPYISQDDHGALLRQKGQIGIMGGDRDGYILGSLDSLAFSCIYNGVTRNPKQNRNDNAALTGLFRASDYTASPGWGYWKYCFEIPTTNMIRVIDSNGQPVQGADVDIFNSVLPTQNNVPREYANDWYPEYVDGQVDDSNLSGSDSEGEISIAASPFGNYMASYPHLYTKYRSTILLIAKITKDSNTFYANTILPKLSEYYWRNQINGTSHPGIIPLKVDWAEDINVTKVLTVNNQSSETSIDTRGNLHTNIGGIKYSCVWGTTPLPNVVTNIFDADQPGSVLRLKDSSDHIVFSLDVNLAPCLRGAVVETHSYPGDYDHIMRIVNVSTGNSIANMDKSGSIILKGDMISND